MCIYPKLLQVQQPNSLNKNSLSIPTDTVKMDEIGSVIILSFTRRMIQEDFIGDGYKIGRCAWHHPHLLCNIIFLSQCKNGRN